MIHRTYIVKMPNETPTTPLDIVVEAYPGSQAAPISLAASPVTAPVGWSGDDGAYYERTARPLHLPNKLSLGASQFIPAFLLGWSLTMYRINTAVVTDLPAVRLSQSLVNDLSSGDGLIVSAPLTDPSYGPVIRLTGGANTASAIFVVHLQVMQARDNDRLSTGK